MDKHVSTIHKNEEKIMNFICGICKQEFNEQANYNAHVKSHDQKFKEEEGNLDIVKDLLKDSYQEGATLITLDEIAPSVKETSNSTNSFKCCDTSSTFKSDNDLNSHTKTNHVVGQYQHEGHLLDYSEEELRNHLSVHENINLKCQKCKFTCDQEIYMELHLETGHDKTVHYSGVICPFCNLESKSQSMLEIHVNNIHTRDQAADSKDEIICEKNETCNLCQDCSFSGNETELKKHETKHSRSIECGSCGNKFPDEQTCNDHINAKHKSQVPEPFACETCGLVVPNFSLLEEHTVKYHAPACEDVIFSCKHCGFSTPLHIELMKHNLVHSNKSTEKPDHGILFLNVLAAQQELILEQFVKVEKRREEQYEELKSMVSVEIETLRQEIKESGKHVSEQYQSKIDNLANSIETFRTVVEQTKAHNPGKEKVLLVGDYLSRNLNISVIKNITDMEVKRAEAVAIAKDDPKAIIPNKNFDEVVPR